MEYVADRIEREVRIPSGGAELTGDLWVPPRAHGIVLFAHGSGSSRQSPRNMFVAHDLQSAGIGTLLFDLLTPAEERVELSTHGHRMDVERLSRRLVEATCWLETQPELRDLCVGYLGASTGSAAAFAAAAQLPERVCAIVSRGGRPDLASAAIPHVRSPTLLIVGGEDRGVIELNQRAYVQLRCDKHLALVPGASHLFGEPGALERVAMLATDWFTKHLIAAG